MGKKIEIEHADNDLKIIREITYDDGQGYVYFILSPNMKMVKIGWAKNSVDDRLKFLQTGSADRLEILNYFSGTLKDETKMHKKFSKYHSHLEWYHLNRELLDYLEKYYPDF